MLVPQGALAGSRRAQVCVSFRRCWDTTPSNHGPDLWYRRAPPEWWYQAGIIQVGTHRCGGRETSRVSRARVRRALARYRRWLERRGLVERDPHSDSPRPKATRHLDLMRGVSMLGKCGTRVLLLRRQAA